MVYCRQVQTSEDDIQSLNSVYQALLLSSSNHQQQVIDSYIGSSPIDIDHLSTGQIIYASYPDKPPTKFHPKWQGPFIIMNLKSAGNVVQCQHVSKCSS